MLQIQLTACDYNVFETANADENNRVYTLCNSSQIGQSIRIAIHHEGKSGTLTFNQW